MKKIKGYFPQWRLPQLQRTLDSLGDLSLKQVRRYSLIVEQGTGAGSYGIGATNAKPGSATELEYRLSWQKNGWEYVCRQGALLFFRGTGELPADRGIAPYFEKKAKFLSHFRNWALVAAALCLVVGYPMEGFTVVRLGAVPLLIALVLSYLIGKYEEIAKQKDTAGS